MNASKEEAAKAIESLNELVGLGIDPKQNVLADGIADFLAVTQKKLPSEAAYAKEKQRKAK